MSKTKSGVQFIITGGTIDSYYDGIKDTVTISKASIIPDFIKSMHIEGGVSFTNVCMKDSRDLTSKDRNKVLSAVRKSPYNKIVITHGTYTMPDTARFLKAALGKFNKTVILTGSMIPIKGFAPSDGPFNLGFAFGKINDLKPGVWVAMNGKIFDPKEVIKNLYSGTFGSIFGEKK